MSDSVGSGFPSTGINKGHLFYDLDEQSLWEYVGGIPRLDSSWKLLSGKFEVDPSILSWGLLQSGAMWFSSSEGVYKGWRGITIQSGNNVNVRHMIVGNIIVDAGTFGVWLDANTDNVDVVNNVLSGNLEYGVYLGKVTTKHRIANNIFYKNGSGLFFLNEPSFGHKYNDYWQQTISNIRDANGPKELDITELTVDPMFVFVTDWKLPVDSVLNNKGEPTPIICPDRLLRFCWEPSNIGAY